MKLILIGGGQYAGLIYSWFSDMYDFVGYIDDVYECAYVKQKYNLPYIGDSSGLEKIHSICDNIIIAIGSNGDMYPRLKYIELFKNKGFSFPSLVHPSAELSKHSSIGMGTIVHLNAIINPMTIIGDFCVISNQAMVSHDVVLGNNIFITPNVVVNGGCKIDDNTFIGTSSVVIPKIKVGKGCIVGASSCVIKDIPDYSKAVGNPARLIGNMR